MAVTRVTNNNKASLINKNFLSFQRKKLIHIHKNIFVHLTIVLLFRMYSVESTFTPSCHHETAVLHLTVVQLRHNIRCQQSDISLAPLPDPPTSTLNTAYVQEITFPVTQLHCDQSSASCGRTLWCFRLCNGRTYVSAWLSGAAFLHAVPRMTTTAAAA